MAKSFDEFLRAAPAPILVSLILSGIEIENPITGCIDGHGLGVGLGNGLGNGSSIPQNGGYSPYWRGRYYDLSNREPSPPIEPTPDNIAKKQMAALVAAQPTPEPERDNRSFGTFLEWLRGNRESIDPYDDGSKPDVMVLFAKWLDCGGEW